MARRKVKKDESAGRVCRDCSPDKARPAPYPGPRCATHHRLRVKRKKVQSRDSYLRRTYSISEDEYDQILEFQGGVCFICGPITGRNGTSKNLSVDHDHACCNGPKSCGRCVRAVLCSDCNRYVLGHLRDNIEALQRAIEVLTDPPAKKVLKRE